MEENKEKKPTYAELTEVAENLYKENRQLLVLLQQVTNIMNKLPFDFEVIKNHDMFSKDFVDMCVKEIETVMTPSTDNSENEENNTNK